MSLLSKPISFIHKLLKNKEITIREIVQESLNNINQTDSDIGAFLSIDSTKALSKADSAQEKFDKTGKLDLLSGVVFGIKDNISTKDYTTTCGSKILEDYKPIYNATVVNNLESHGAIIVGKNNMDEFAMGSSNENSAFKTVRNPRNLDYVPGGSSGGSAAAVAANQVMCTLGSDTGGSVRQPASLCGVVGLKPTYGLVSRYGLIAFASSLDQIGPLTKTVEDSAYVLQAIAGYDPKDSTSLKETSKNYINTLDDDVKGMKIGIPKEMMGEGIDPEVRDAIQNVLHKLQGMGVVVEEVSLPHLEYAVAAYYLIAPAEASSNLARYDGIRYGTRGSADSLWDVFLNTRADFGAEVKRRIMLGTYALSSGYYDAYYLQAQKIRTLIIQDYQNIFKDFDLIIGPTTPTPAFKIGEDVKTPLTMYMKDICTVTANLAGLPALSQPCGLSNGLPIGLQITGPALSEAKILNLGNVIEKIIK